MRLFALAAVTTLLPIALVFAQTAKPKPAGQTRQAKPARAKAAAAKLPGGFARTASGMQYKLFRQTASFKFAPRQLPGNADPAYPARVGKVLSLHLEYRTSGDSLLMKSRAQQFGLPVRVPLEALTKRTRGTEAEAFSLLQPGDSGVFRFNADTLFRRNARQLAPANLKKNGNFVTVYARAVQLQSRDEATKAAQADQQLVQQKLQAQQAAYSAQNLAQDQATIRAWLAQNAPTVKVEQTPGGVLYYITERGTGPLPTAGQTVQVKYRGSLLATDKEFDSTAKHGGQPIAFPLGRGQVIPGWDEGIARLPVGSKAVLLIPSPLAYGERGAGADIPPRAILKFEVELVDAK